VSWFQRIKTGLARSSNKLVERIGAALGRGKLDAATFDELEEALIGSDLGPAAAARLIAALKARRLPADSTGDEVRSALSEEIVKIVAPLARPFTPNRALKPHVVLVAGVNGTGKTTTIGKLAHRLSREGKRVVLAAGDTFRAAAVGQLKIWGERAGAAVMTAPPNGDPAALAYEALERARADGADVLLIDTAGRLHNKADLMAELQKILRVIRKLDDAAPHDVFLVLDATTGQNAMAQVEVFKSMVDVTGLVVTKLDGTARGGILVAIAEKFALPVIAIGIGEGVEDLAEFVPEAFAQGLLGLGVQP
jgi:fused signal recognition particle receptor